MFGVNYVLPVHVGQILTVKKMVKQCISSFRNSVPLKEKIEGVICGMCKKYRRIMGAFFCCAVMDLSQFNEQKFLVTKCFVTVVLLDSRQTLHQR